MRIMNINDQYLKYPESYNKKNKIVIGNVFKLWLSVLIFVIWKVICSIWFFAKKVYILPEMYPYYLILILANEAGTPIRFLRVSPFAGTLRYTRTISFQHYLCMLIELKQPMHSFWEFAPCGSATCSQ